MKQSTKGILIGACAAGMLMPLTASATNGYFSHGYGITSKGQAGAGVATSANAMSGATNPAALAAVGNRFDFGMEYFTPDRNADLIAGTGSGTNLDGNDDSSFLIPEFAYNHQWGANKTYGVIVYGNGGMNTNYKAIAQYAGASSATKTGVDMKQLFIAPTITFKVAPKHSIGVSLNLVYQTFEAYGIGGFCGFKAATCANNAAPGAAASDLVGLSDQGVDSSTGYSLKVGWTGEFADNFQVGFAYQMKTDMSNFDKYNQLFAEQGDFDIPSNWTLGVAYQPASGVNLMFDIQQINYTDIASISNANNSSMGALGTSNGRGFGWEDMTVYKLGGEFEVNSNLVMRAGYSTTDQPIGANDTSFNLLAPAVIEEHYTFGVTYTMANKSEINAFLMYAPEVTVNGNTSGAGTSGNANIKMSQTAFGVGYGWKF